MSTYAWIDLGAVFFPFVFSFHPRLRFHREWRALFSSIVVMMGLFIPWDALFTKAGVWGFTPEHLAPIRLWGLPLEEWLFFICVPYACLFTYHCSRVWWPFDVDRGWTKWASGALSLFLFSVAIAQHHKAYTCTAWSLCAVWVVFTGYVQRPVWLARFYLSYAVLLIPFLIINGLLTGSGLEQPVVWYNDTENLGLRLFTIPVEDVFYGMLMVGMTTSFYELFRRRV
jgi:lycopene cyclase domain-containing protein